MNKIIWVVFALLYAVMPANAQKLISANYQQGAFPIARNGVATLILVDSNDLETVKKSTTLFGDDIERVTGIKPVITNNIQSSKNIIIAGSIGSSSFIKQLIAGKKLDITPIKNKWEAFKLIVISKPFPGVENALVIAGSDRRGTAYGLMELSRQMGVSPWYYFADVPPSKKKEIFIPGAILLIPLL